MEFSLVDVARANFRTDKISDELNSKFMDRLGMRQRYQPARLAIACSLSDSKKPNTNHLDSESGMVIKGDTLFGTGTELSIWLSMIVQHDGRSDMDTRRLISLVGGHWKRGLGMLDKKWNESGEDVNHFIHNLTVFAELPTASGRRKKMR